MPFVYQTMARFRISTKFDLNSEVLEFRCPGDKTPGKLPEVREGGFAV